ncbi:MAG: fibronectin type III domain-containing protein, partial [Oscillospiraceae bacterium]
KKSYKVYTDPEVIAIVQSSPYFEDIAQSFPGEYPNQAATEWGKSKSTGTGTSATTNWSAGAYVSVDVSFAVANEEEVEAKYTGSKEISDSTTVSEEFAYQTTAGEDSVVVICVPYMIYEYEVENQDKSVGQIVSYYPMPVVEHQITVEQYDAIAAITEGLEPIRGNVLTSTPGDPASYDKWPAGSTDIHTPSKSGHAAAASANFNETISGTVETESEESRTSGFEINTKVGLGGGFAGNNVMAGVVAGGGNEWTSATVSSKGTSFAGTVDALPEDAAQYSFNWKISRREATLNGNPVQLVCYKTANVSQGVGVPRELSVDEVTKNTMTISWEQVAEALQYKVYEKTTNGYLPVATVANVANANSDRQSLTLTNLAVNREYTYKIAAISADGNGEGLKSDEVAGTTLPGDGTLSVTEQPKDQTKIPGDMAEFKAAGTYLNAAEESLELAYAWYQRAKGTSTWKSISGAYSATYSVAAKESMDGNEYYCLIYPVSNASNVIKTNVATLSIGKATSTTALTGNPTAETVLTTDGTTKPTEQSIVLYSDGITFTKMKVGQTSTFIWSGSDGKYYTYTADDTVPTKAISAVADTLRIGDKDFPTKNWANDTSVTVDGVTVAKDAYGRYTIKGEPVSAYVIYRIDPTTSFISKDLTTVKTKVMT